MSRTARKLERGEPFRDSTLILIATEGEKGEKKYFDTLVSRRYYATSRVRVHVVPSKSGHSSPEHVLENLREAEREYEIGPDPHFDAIMPNVPAAIANASRLDPTPDSRRIAGLLTRVYVIVQEVVKWSQQVAPGCPIRSKAASSPK